MITDHARRDSVLKYADVHGNRMHFTIFNHLKSLTIPPVTFGMCLVCACLFFKSNERINFFKSIVCR